MFWRVLLLPVVATGEVLADRNDILVGGIFIRCWFRFFVGVGESVDFGVADVCAGGVVSGPSCGRSLSSDVDDFDFFDNFSSPSIPRGRLTPVTAPESVLSLDSEVDSSTALSRAFPGVFATPFLTT